MYSERKFGYIALAVEQLGKLEVGCTQYDLVGASMLQARLVLYLLYTLRYYPTVESTLRRYLLVQYIIKTVQNGQYEYVKG